MVTQAWFGAVCTAPVLNKERKSLVWSTKTPGTILLQCRNLRTPYYVTKERVGGSAEENSRALECVVEWSNVVIAGLGGL
jgi:hypothetical protein